METACASLPPRPPPLDSPRFPRAHRYARAHARARHAHSLTHTAVSTRPHWSSSYFPSQSLFFPRKPHFPRSMSPCRHFPPSVIPFSFKLSNQCAVFYLSVLWIFAPLPLFPPKKSRISKTFTKLQDLNGNYILCSQSAEKFISSCPDSRFQPPPFKIMFSQLFPVFCAHD